MQWGRQILLMYCCVQASVGTSFISACKMGLKDPEDENGLTESDKPKESHSGHKVHKMEILPNISLQFFKSSRRKS